MQLRTSLHLIAAAGIAWSTLGTTAHAEDIDIFVGSNGAADPNVLIILDNSSNWSAANQGWPEDTSPPVACGNDCNKQGYYELKAIRSVVDALPDSGGINLGLMLFNNSNATHDGGYVRYHIRPMDADNQDSFKTEINEIITHFNTETAASSVQYGATLFDAFKYFGGLTNPDHAATNTAPDTNPTYDGVPVFGTQIWGSVNADTDDSGDRKRDPDAYTENDTHYQPPATSACARNHIIFIGNGFPSKGNTVPDMEEVLAKLLNPETPAASIDEFEVTTYTPVLGSCAVVDSAPGNSCSMGLEDCQNALSSYPNDTYDPKNTSGSNGSIHQCVEEKKTCGNKKYRVHACAITAWNVVTGIPSANAAYRFGDEYADFLYRTDVSDNDSQQNVALHAIDVFKDQPSDDQQALMRSMATKGGGLYFSASSADQIVEALTKIFTEIRAVNSTFASASLPVNATNRAQNENQVFIGMFRPDPDAKPRWFGNLKRYQLALFDRRVGLADVDGNAAVNTQTGFVRDCAKSFWTSDSGSWWQQFTLNPNPAGRCLSAVESPYSDAPDGPWVEKGAVAEVIRKGNNPPTTDLIPTWQVDADDRAVFTLTAGTPPTLAAFSAATTGLDADLANFTLGRDDNDDNPYRSRPSLHGGVIHSRPLPVNYDNSAIVVFYGANDGTLRAVDAASGKELWAFVAPEFHSHLARLRENDPLVSYPNVTDPDAEPMSYYFDGSIGVFQNVDNSQVWIYPTMRRGGSAIYAFDVSADDNDDPPPTPQFMWKVDANSAGFGNIGQTWSRPNPALVRYGDVAGTEKKVLIVGGGYDPCEDADSVAPDCNSPKGANVYVMDAQLGTLIKGFSTTRSIAAEVSLVDIDNDGYVDYGYAVDTGGAIWRIRFVNPATGARLSPDGWTLHKIAATNGSGEGRKFLFPPALLPAKDDAGDFKIYLAIGTGDREHPLLANYPYTEVTNRFYVFLDDPTVTTSANLDSTDVMYDFTDVTSCSTAGSFPSSNKKGWFMDLDQYGQGEQTVTSALIVGGMVTFSTNRPVDGASCVNTLGEARGYWLNLLNASGAIGVEGNCGGSRSGTFVGGGLPPSPVLAQVPVYDPLVGDVVNTTVIIGAVQKSGGASSGIEGQEIEPTITSKRSRVYWFTESDE